MDSQSCEIEKYNFRVSQGKQVLAENDTVIGPSIFGRCQASCDRENLVFMESFEIYLFISNAHKV